MTKSLPSLDHARSILTEDVLRHRKDLPRFEPMDMHPWLAMSLMQKAIRRGREELALRASATLLTTSPDRFWRRICVTAYEDIGIADVETMAVVTAALMGKRWRSGIGGEWAVASYLVHRMSHTAKCRAADDLAVVCQWHPSIVEMRSGVTVKTVPELLNPASEHQRIPEQALALWFAMGTDRCRSPVFRNQQGNPDAVWDFLIGSGAPANAVEIAREGFRKSNSILCPFVSLLIPIAGEVTNEIIQDDIPEEEMIGGVPCWAYDVHVREGTQAISRFIKLDSETTRWLTRHVPHHERFRVLGSMLFRIESGAVDRRLAWETGNELRRMADLEPGGVAATDMQEGLRLLKQDIPTLNQQRRRVAETVPKKGQLSLSGTRP